MDVQVRTENGLSSETTLTVADEAFDRTFNESLVHQVVVAYLAGARAGTKANKSRADVRGGSAKPWRQKGTGRARAGTIRSPLWRGGGVTFAASPRDHSQKVNRKMYRAAMRCIVSELLRQDRLLVVEKLALEDAKTRLLAARLEELGVTRGLLVLEGPNRNIELASGNLPQIDVVSATNVDPVSLVRSDKVVISAAALKRLEERLA